MGVGTGRGVRPVPVGLHRDGHPGPHSPHPDPVLVKQTQQFPGDEGGFPSGDEIEETASECSNNDIVGNNPKEVSGCEDTNDNDDWRDDETWETYMV